MTIEELYLCVRDSKYIVGQISWKKLFDAMVLSLQPYDIFLLPFFVAVTRYIKHEMVNERFKDKTTFPFKLLIHAVQTQSE